MSLGGIRAPPGHWPIPQSVEVINWQGRDALGFHWPFWGIGTQLTVGRRGMLRDFLRIVDSITARDFASRWGPLGLCRHGVPQIPMDFDTLCSMSEKCIYRQCPLIKAARQKETIDVELVNPWVHLAAGASAILQVAAALHRDRQPDAKDWAKLPFLDAYPSENFQGIERQRFFLGLAIHTWLDLGRISLDFSWSSPKASLRVLPRSLFGALGLELALVAAKTEGVAYCCGCGMAYTPERQPRAGEEHFCHDCGRGVALKRAQARWREKRKLKPSGKPKRRGLR